MLQKTGDSVQLYALIGNILGCMAQQFLLLPGIHAEL
jgi:hypothetical protein